MSGKRYCKISVLIIATLIFLGIFMPAGSSASASELSLTVSYSAKCGEPTTFTVQASGGSGNYMYYFGNITRDGEDGSYFVMDPSRLPGYKTDNKFQFTFYASGVYYLHFYVMDKGVTPIVTKRTIVKVTINDPKYPSIETIADRLAAKCKASCKTEYEKALWLHDWLVDNCAYDYSFLYCGAEGALVRGKGTCESYHRAYTMLLNRVGIANGRIEGNGHVWTAVRMDGKWYQVDVTWDANGYSSHSYENYLYFGLNDELMKIAHSDHSPKNGYVSNSLENNYLIKSGTVRRWSDPLSKSVTQNIQTGKTSFEIPVTESLPGNTQNIVYGLAAYQLSTQKWTTETHNVKLQASYSNGKMKISAAYIPIVTEEKPSEPQPEKPSTGTNSSSQSGNTTEKPQTGTTPSDTNNPSNTPNSNSGNTTEKPQTGTTPSNTPNSNSGNTTEKPQTGTTPSNTNKPSNIPNTNSGTVVSKPQTPSNTASGNGGSSTSQNNGSAVTPSAGTNSSQENNPSDVPANITADNTASSGSQENTPTETPSGENVPTQPEENVPTQPEEESPTPPETNDPETKPNDDISEDKTVSDGSSSENDNNFIILICIGAGAVLLIAAGIIIFLFRKKLFKLK